MENSTDSRTGRLRYIYSTLSIYLARVELVKLSQMLEKAYIPRRSKFGGFLQGTCENLCSKIVVCCLTLLWADA